MQFKAGFFLCGSAYHTHGALIRTGKEHGYRRTHYYIPDIPTFHNAYGQVLPLIQDSPKEYTMNHHYVPYLLEMLGRKVGKRHHESRPPRRF